MGLTSGGCDTFFLGANAIAHKPRVPNKSGEPDRFEGYKAPTLEKTPLSVILKEDKRVSQETMFFKNKQPGPRYITLPRNNISSEPIRFEKKEEI